MTTSPGQSPFVGWSGHPSSPATPTNVLQRGPRQNEPSSATASGSNNSPTFDPSIRLNEVPRSTFRNVFAASANGSGRQLVVRSDPSLVTCFDPSDKELYDLWAPK